MGKLKPELQMSGVHLPCRCVDTGGESGAEEGWTHMVPGSDKEHLVRTEA